MKTFLVFFTLVTALIYVFTPYSIEGTSMDYGLIEGDVVLTSKIYSEIKRGDIVVIKHPLETKHRLYIKRCLAIGGDVIFQKKRAFYLQLEGNSTKTYNYAKKYTLTYTLTPSGYFLKDPYVHYYAVTHNKALEVPKELESYPVTKIKPNHYFVAGDYRDNSTDSRFYDAVPQKWLQSKVIYILKKPHSWEELIKIREY